MDQKFVVVTDENFSQPMSRDAAIKTIKDYDKKGIVAYIVSEEEAKRIKTPENFNEPRWE
ncbi:hypothetical protein NSA23_08465 [Anaerosalibacter massiliensis]|uniref:Uncharacterized protein n=1 Tax=Anaerosalibacter massiliensis TaxID=1347392 RepID=A0A9X2MHJ4_9FIRM|nr:hypothetical protein [Anaerosalibacter massiliensis]MCR2044150.1 hypothetical protein [Anaerosalibacter massiliensis]